MLNSLGNVFDASGRMQDSPGKDDIDFIFATPPERELDFWHATIARMCVLDAQPYISLRVWTLL